MPSSEILLYDDVILPATVVNVVPKLPPTSVAPATIATATRAAKRPYSMAVAPRREVRAATPRRLKKDFNIKPILSLDLVVLPDAESRHLHQLCLGIKI